METARALADNLAVLLRREHEAMADFLSALAEFDALRGRGKCREPPPRASRGAMERAGGRCEAVLANGETCGSTHDLEFHHVTARAKGGKARTVDDIRVTCRKHNVLEACRDFGDDVVLRYSRGGRRLARAGIDARNGKAGEPDTPAASTP